MFWLRRFQKMEVVKKEHKQRLINSFVNSVYLYDDKLVISFNYKEECITVTLKEVIGSSIECFGAPQAGLDPIRVEPLLYFCLYHDGKTRYKDPHQSNGTRTFSHNVNRSGS